MKATLEFNLPDDESQLELARRAPALLAAVRAIDEHLKWSVKSGAPDAVRSVRDRLHEILVDEGVDHLLA